MSSLLWRLLGVIFLSFILCVLMLPSLLSTQWGSQFAVNCVNSFIPGKLEIDTLHLKWGKGQTFEGIRLKDINDQTVLNFEKISTEATLWQLFNHATKIGNTQIKNFNAKIVTDEKGITNLENALGFSNTYILSGLPSVIILSNVNANLCLFSEQQPFSLKIRGFTKQEEVEGSFEVNFALNDFNEKDWENLKEKSHNFIDIEKSKEVNVTMKIVNFPVLLIDHLVASRNPELKGMIDSLLGDRLNLRLEKIADNDQLAFNIKAESPLMQGAIQAKIVDGTFLLKEPSLFKFYLTPNFLKSFLNQIELVEKTPLSLTCGTFSFPLKKYSEGFSFDPTLLDCKAEVSIPKAEIQTSSLGQMKIQNLLAHFNSDSESVSLQLQGSGEKDSETFEIHLNSSVKKTNFLHQFYQNLQTELMINHFPIKSILLKNYSDWAELLGSHADLQVVLGPNQGKEWEASISLITPKLILKNAKFQLGKTLALKSPASFTWSGNSESFNNLLKLNSFFIDEPFSIQTTLSEFQLPLDNPKLAQFQLESALSHLRFSHLLFTDQININFLTIKIIGKNLEKVHSELKGEVALTTQDGTHSPLFLAPIQINQRSQWQINSDGKIEMSNAALQLFNSILLCNLEGRLKPSGEFQMTRPLQIQYNLTPEALNELNRIYGKEWSKFQENSNIVLTINPIVFDLKTCNFAALKLQGILSIDQFSIKDASGGLPFLKDLSIPWVFNCPMSTFYGNVKGFASIEKKIKPGDISGHFQVWFTPGYYDFEHLKIETHMNCSGMPTSILNMLLSTEDLSPILGPIIDLNLKTYLDPSNENDGYWDLQLDSSNLHINGRFKLEDTTSIFDTAKPPSFRLILNPESYLYLKKLLSIKNDKVLAKPFTLSGSLSQFYLPMKESENDHSLLEFQFSSTEIKWEDDSLPTFKLEGRINSQNLIDRVSFFTKIHSSLDNSLSLEGMVLHPFDNNWKITDWKKMGLNLNLQGRNVTGEFLQSLSLVDQDRSQKLNVMIGKSIELDANCQLQNFNGPLKASLKGSQGEILLDSEIVEGRTIKLKTPLKGSMILTPQLSQIVLSKNVPLLKSALEGDKPITFSIEPLDFSCPLFPFSLNEIKIGKGTIDFGKVRFKNEGELKSFLSFFNSFSDPYLTIWFTPLYFQMEHGKLVLKRMDMLVANTYPFASWGDINLNQNVAHLIIGLSSLSLKNAFGIKGLDENFMLQIPLHSTDGSIEIDKTKATARISSLIAQSKGGSTGKFIGNILDLALSDSGEVIVPPTTQPFPWADQFKTENSEQEEKMIKESEKESLPIKENPSKKKKKKKHRKEKDSFQQIQEGAFQILDQLIGINSPTSNDTKRFQLTMG